MSFSLRAGLMPVLLEAPRAAGHCTGRMMHLPSRNMCLFSEMRAVAVPSAKFQESVCQVQILPDVISSYFHLIPANTATEHHVLVTCLSYLLHYCYYLLPPYLNPSCFHLLLFGVMLSLTSSVVSLQIAMGIPFGPSVRCRWKKANRAEVARGLTRSESQWLVAICSLSSNYQASHHKRCR